MELLFIKGARRCFFIKKLKYLEKCVICGGKLFLWLCLKLCFQGLRYERLHFHGRIVATQCRRVSDHVFPYFLSIGNGARAMYACADSEGDYMFPGRWKILCLFFFFFLHCLNMAVLCSMWTTFMLPKVLQHIVKHASPLLWKHTKTKSAR